VLEVLGQVYRGHPARADFAVDPVRSSHSSGEACCGISQGELRCRICGYDTLGGLR
jgi:hypothetical protein